MAGQRPLIVPWLVEMLDAQQYPGVTWLNPERTRFRVPWKHGSRHSVIPEDFQLFEGWAIASGRFNPHTDKRTPSDWKRNFRSALNRKPEIKMVEDNSRDSDDPHKIFEIQPPAGCDRNVAHSVSTDANSTLDGNMGACGDSSSSSQDDTLESILNSLDISSPEEGLGTENPLSYVGQPTSNVDHVLPVPHLQDIMATNQLGLGTENPLSYIGQPSSNVDPVLPVPHLQDIMATNQLGLGTENPLSYIGQPSSNVDPVLPVPHLQDIMATSKLETDFEVRAYYRGELVFKEVFSNVKGLCFVPMGCCGNYPELADVVLPAPNTVHDKKQASFTERILEGLKPGVVVRTGGAFLLGTRRGSCRVYWSHSEMPEDGMPHGVLPKEEYGNLYNMQQFVQELIGYMERQKGSPNYSLWLCFGEDWPDPNRCWKKKLVMVQVILKSLEMLYQLSQACGASSLDDVERDLRISDSLQAHDFYTQLKGWEERMEMELYN